MLYLFFNPILSSPSPAIFRHYKIISVRKKRKGDSSCWNVILWKQFYSLPGICECSVSALQHLPSPAATVSWTVPALFPSVYCTLLSDKLLKWSNSTCAFENLHRFQGGQGLAPRSWLIRMVSFLSTKLSFSPTNSKNSYIEDPGWETLSCCR